MKISNTAPVSCIHNVNKQIEGFSSIVMNDATQMMPPAELCFPSLLRLGVNVFLCCSVLFFVRACLFVMVPLNLKCLHCLQHSFFDHLFNVY